MRYFIHANGNIKHTKRCQKDKHSALILTTHNINNTFEYYYYALCSVYLAICSEMGISLVWMLTGTLFFILLFGYNIFIFP